MVQHKDLVLRKYKIAQLLGLYSPASQTLIIGELCNLLDIDRQMFSLYMSSQIGSKRNLSDTKLKIIADYFGVRMEDVRNEPQTKVVEKEM